MDPNEKPKLVVFADAMYERTIDLTPERRYVLGRRPECKNGETPIIIGIGDSGCSRNHAELWYKDDEWHVRDISRNGTCFYEGSETTGQAGAMLVAGKEVALANYDRLRIGTTDIVFISQYLQIKGEGNCNRPQSTSDTWHGLPEENAIKHGLLSYLLKVASQLLSVQNNLNKLQIIANSLIEKTKTETVALIAAEDPAKVRLLLGCNRDRSRVTSAYRAIPGWIMKKIFDTRSWLLAVNCLSRDYLTTLQFRDSTILSSLLCAPAVCEDRIVGVVHLYTVNPSIVLDQSDCEVAGSVAVLLGSLIAGLEKSGSAGGDLDLQTGIEAVIQSGARPAEPYAGSRSFEDAKAQLRLIVAKLEEYRWERGAASMDMFENRYGLTKRVKRIVAKFPKVRDLQEFQRLIEGICD